MTEHATTIEDLARDCDLSLAEFAQCVTAQRLDAAVDRLTALGDPPYEAIAKTARDLGLPVRALMVLIEQTVDSGGAWPDPIDLDELAKIEPTAPAMIIKDWLPCGYAALFAGHGGAGKSGIALDLAVCIALGLPWCGFEVQRRRVLYLSCEDREGVLHWRLYRICHQLGKTISALCGQLSLIDLVGHDSVLWERDPRTGKTETDAYKRLEELVAELGIEVVVVDGVSDAFGGNENARTEVQRFLNSLVALVPPDTGAVLLIAHINKQAALSATAAEGYSGSTGWHNAVRARWYLYPETACSETDRPERTGDLILELQKANFGRADQAIRFHWDDGAHLFVGRRVIPETEADRTHRGRVECEGILAAFRACADAGIDVPAATTGNRTGLHVLAAQEAFPRTLTHGEKRSNSRRFWRHIEHLRRMRQIKDSVIRRNNRHTASILVLSDAGGSKDAPNASNDDEGIQRTIDARRHCVDASNDAGGYRGCARNRNGNYP